MRKKKLIFPYEGLVPHLFLSTNLVMFLLSEGEGSLFMASRFCCGSSPGPIIQSHWHYLPNPSVQNLGISATHGNVLEHLNEKGAWLFLCWQKLRPAREEFMNEL